jgi:hypothetical protein
MGLIYSQIETQKSMTASATAITSNTALNYTAHVAHIDVYANKLSTTASSNLVLVQKVINVYMNTQGGTPEISIEGQDLFDLNSTAFPYSNYITVQSTTAGALQDFALPYYFSPYPKDPTMPYGIQPLQLNQVTLNIAADVAATFQTYVYDLYFEGAAPKATNGYLVTQEDKETMTAGAPTWTKCYGKNLMGVFYGATAFLDDVAASAANNVTDVRTNAVADSRSIIFGPMAPLRAGTSSYFPWITASSPFLLDDGDFFIDYGIRNSTGNGGINILQKPNIEIQTVGGAGGTIHINPILLR